jgi:hypothetical protein
MDRLILAQRADQVALSAGEDGAIDLTFLETGETLELRSIEMLLFEDGQQFQIHPDLIA